MSSSFHILLELYRTFQKLCSLYPSSYNIAIVCISPGSPPASFASSHPVMSIYPFQADSHLSCFIKIDCPTPYSSCLWRSSVRGPCPSRTFQKRSFHILPKPSRTFQKRSYPETGERSSFHILLERRTFQKRSYLETEERNVPKNIRAPSVAVILF